MAFRVTRAGGTGSRVPVQAWQVASSTEVASDGELVSLPAFDARGWVEAAARSTVMAALVGNGEYEDVFFSTNMRDKVDAARFAVPWWFRTAFVVGGGLTVGAPSRGAGGPATGGVAPGAVRTHVRTNGIIPRADLWVNGRQVAAARGAEALAGAYAVRGFDVTELVHPGANALALLVHPGTPLESLSVGWVDWSQLPPDSNMGPWRDVVVEQTGDVRLGTPRVTTTLPEGATGPALLSVTVEAHNHSDAARSVLVAGRITGPGGPVTFRREIDLAPGKEGTVTAGGPDGELLLQGPALWWPRGEGDQPLYHLSVTATVEGVASDHADVDFGVRTVDSDVRAGGGRLFRINGRPVQVMGGGWSPDLFLRYDYRRLGAQVALTAHMGLNAIRPEGKLENPEFYDL